MSVVSRRRRWRLLSLAFLLTASAVASVASPASAAAGLAITGPTRVDVGDQASYEADVRDTLGQPVEYSWTIAGREVGTAATLTYTFATVGATTLGLRVLDSAGNTLNASLVVDVIEMLPFVDRDSDGYAPSADCDDGNATIRPNATEVLDNGVDEDCDGRDAVNFDRDGDGYQRPLDCNDTNIAVHPGAREQRGNAIDENCDGNPEPWSRLAGVKLIWSGQGSRSYTTLQRLALEGVPRAAKVTVKCSGRGCPRAPSKFTPNGGSIRLTPYTRRRLRAGTKLTARVDYPDYVAAVVVMTIRAGRLPVTQSLCQAPGERQPSACR